MFNLGENSMKKTLVALAALAATGAFAQSSVTLYGVAEATVDMGYKKTVDTRTDTFTPAGVTAGLATGNSTAKSAFRVQDGNSQGVGTSRLGWRGTEDLGAGLKANFQLEMGLRIDDGCTTNETSTCASGGSGNSGGNTFGRNAWVGASGGFGEVRLGRQVLGSFGVQANSWVAGSSSGLYEVGAASSGGMTAGLLSGANTGGTAPTMGGVRFANAIKYLTPNIGGFSGTVSLRAPEGNSTTNSGTATPATSETKNKMGLDLSAEYANGPLYLGLGYNKTNTTTAANTALGAGTNVASATSGPTKAFTLGASYNLGVVQPFFNYTKQTADTSTATNNGGPTILLPTVIPTGLSSTVGTTTDKAWSLGLKAPFGPVTLITSYGKAKITSNANIVTSNVAAGTTAGDGKKSAFQIGAQYALSKRTLLEANYGFYKLENAAVTTNVANSGTIVNSNVKESALNVGLRHTF
jgi:predicted porin